ncbi:6-phosphogluconolactonase [Spirochaetia bacterium]|nr:6-phosphogluconolactonase [Spirochaetia bacterium]
MYVMGKKAVGYIGTYTEAAYAGRGQGIYSFLLDADTGAVERLRLCGKSVNPSYLALGPSGKYLYAVNELGGDPTEGMVSSFAISGEGEELRLLSRKPSAGKDPCHIVVNGAETFAVVSNYSSGTVAALPIDADGVLSDPSQVIELSGKGRLPERQVAPHAHSFTFDKTMNRGFVCDLGADRVMAYTIAGLPKPLVPCHTGGEPWISVSPGSGPRHGVFHPSGGYFYLSNEIDLSLNVYGYTNTSGTFELVQRLSSCPDKSPCDSAAAIKITPNGQFLFVSNREHDSIALLRVREKGLEYVDCFPSGGHIPRDFAIDPGGNFLVAGHQRSDNLVVFRIDYAAACIKKIGEYEAPSSVCVIFANKFATNNFARSLLWD